MRVRVKPTLTNQSIEDDLHGHLAQSPISGLVRYISIFGLLSTSTLVLFVLALPLSAQEFDAQHVVFPITNFIPDVTFVAPLHVFTGPMFTAFGTGFCLDRNCRFVGTTYHVAKAMGASQILIKRVFSVHRYL